MKALSEDDVRRIVGEYVVAASHALTSDEEGDSVAQSLRDAFQSPNVLDSNMEEANVVDVIAQVASAIRFAAKHLGNGNASTGGFGAIEGHAMMVRDAGREINYGLDAVAASIDGLAEAVREQTHRVDADD
jgi:hypothetical protein